MKETLFLKDKDLLIGVVRNPYERVVFEYFWSLNYIGMDKWLYENPLTPQYKLFQDCDHVVRLENLHYDLQDLNLQPKDTSILKGNEYIADWKRWYTLKSKQIITQTFARDLSTYGYRY